MKILPRYLYHRHMNLDNPLLHIRHFALSLTSLNIILNQFLHLHKIFLYQKDNIALGHVSQDVLIQRESSRKTRILIMTLMRLNHHLKMAPSLFKIFVIL